MSSRLTSWSDVPVELLSDISQRLENRSEILTFRAVCKTWQESAPSSLLDGQSILSQMLPHHFWASLAYTDGSRYPSEADHCLVLVETTVLLLQSVKNPDYPPFLFTVEEMNPGKLYLRKPLNRSNFNTLPLNFPNKLDLSQFHVSEISRHHTLSYAPHDSDDMKQMKNRDSSHFHKVVLYVNPNKCESTTDARIGDCTLLVLHSSDGFGGTLAKINLEDGVVKPLRGRGIRMFDDIVMFKERVCAIDRKGRVYWFENGKLGRSMAVDEPIFKGLGRGRRNRLVVSYDELYLVNKFPKYMECSDFKVYKLNEKQKKWVELNGIGDDRILIATLDDCFFVPAKDIPTWRGNCLVFNIHAFPAYGLACEAEDKILLAPKGTTLEILVFHFGSGEYKTIESYPDYPTVLQPQTWLLWDACLHNQGFWKGKPTLINFFPNQCPESSSNNEASCTPGVQVDTQAQDPNSATDIHENLSAEALGVTTKLQGNTTIVADLAAPTTTKSRESGVSKTKFQGVDVSSDLLPTLKEIWVKHGNILEGSKVQSDDRVSWALESIAKVAILIENTSGRSLNSSQADYLKSTIHDLRHMHLNISWLPGWFPLL